MSNVLVYCPWLCGCRCIIRMKTIHCTCPWFAGGRLLGAEQQAMRPG